MCALMPRLQDAELTRGQLRAKMHGLCWPHGAPKELPESSTRTTIAEAEYHNTEDPDRTWWRRGALDMLRQPDRSW
jgi:hypothetical protein